MDDQLSPIPPLDARQLTHFDQTVDVVVVGLGCAGTAAAIEAAEAGAEVAAIERQGAAGGTSAMSGGLIYLGGGTAVQQACGYDDSPDNMAAFLTWACGPDADIDKIEAYCNGSVAQFDWLVDHGVPFRAEFYPEPNREPPTDAGLLFSGGEDSWPATEVAVPVPRGHKPQHVHAAGRFLMERLLAAVATAGVAVTSDSRAERLIVDDGVVIGIEVRSGSTTTRLRARGGVVLAAGGFAYNEAMAARYCPELLRPDDAWRIGTDADDGRGIRLAEGAGAALAHMDSIECAFPIVPPLAHSAGLLVNGKGRRFINEDAYNGRIGLAALTEHDGEVYFVVDDSIFDEQNPVFMRLTWAADSVEELEADIGLPSGALVATVAAYNDAAARGEDPEFHKRAELVRPLRSPFGAVDLRVDSKAIYAPFTLGGVRTDAHSRVLTSGGDAVPGLFAAGRTTSGIAVGNYVSGISLGDGMFFGRRAGAGAAGATR
jgi:3-oxo-5alpha-steroid 4-dehydrogenase